MLTVKEIAKYFKVHRNTVYRWLKQGVPCYRNDKLIRFDIKEVEQWMKNK